MPITDLKIRKVKSYNPQLKKHGFTTCAIINGTETFDSVAEEASRNTTINKYELTATLGIAAEQFARALKNGYAVDLGPLGKIYPTVTSKWTETAEEQTKSMLIRGIRYDAGADIKAAITAARLSWEKLDEEKTDASEGETKPEEDTTPGEGEENNGSTEGGGSTEEGGEEATPTKYKAFFYVNGNLQATLELEPGEVINAPEAPSGYEWEEFPYRMPAEDITVNAVRTYIPGGGGGSGFE